MTLLKACAATFVAVLCFCPARSLSAADQITPLIASPLTTDTTSFAGTDGKQHVVYELVLTNTLMTPATLQQIDVIDPGKPDSPLKRYQGATLLAHLRMPDNTTATGPDVEYTGTRLFLIDLAFEVNASVPVKLEHRIGVRGAAMPGHEKRTPVPMTYQAAPIAVHSSLRVISPPLKGKGWVVVNGCCEAGGVHRATGLPVNGGIYFAQRFAIDWMRLDSAGRMVSGDPANVLSYTNYDADIIAVADGTVAETLNTLDDQKPGQMPDPSTITLANVDGNHVVLDLGGGVYAFYAHLRKGSVVVKKGQSVKRGELLGHLGNTGNTSAPHLHFHLMDRPSVLGANGIPYLIDTFTISGQISEADAQKPGLEGEFKSSLFATKSPRQKQFPIDSAIVDFSGVQPKGGQQSGK